MKPFSFAAKEGTEKVSSTKSYRIDKKLPNQQKVTESTKK
jgi:hypothetical protein